VGEEQAVSKLKRRSGRPAEEGGGRPSGPPLRVLPRVVGLWPRAACPNRLRLGIRQHPASSGTIFPVLPGARADDRCLIECLQMLGLGELTKAIVPQFAIAAKRHTAEVALRRGDAARAQVERTRRALCWRGCAPRPRRRAQRGEEAWGQGETRSGAPTRSFNCLPSPQGDRPERSKGNAQVFLY
jgi:hypothetical protein